MSLCTLPPDLSAWVVSLAAALDPRVQQRLAGLLTGLLFARGRRTVTSWLRAGGLTEEFRSHYSCVASIGRRTTRVAVRVLLDLAVPVVVGDQHRLLFGLDDTPTRRYGPQVQGAGIHHHPTPGPADQTFLYGHVWVTLAWLAPHRLWGTIALPLLARLYIRHKDVAKLPPQYHWKFQTKLQQAAELVQWLVCWLGHLGKPIWLVTDGAYATKELLRPARQLGVVVVSRLRHNASLWSVPSPQRQPGQRGPLPGSSHHIGEENRLDGRIARNRKQVLVIPASHLSFASDTGFCSVFGQQRHRQPADPGQILRRVILPRAALIFPKTHVQYPVQVVLDRPGIMPSKLQVV